ncbi:MULTISPECIES: pheST operon leader peptide PheM [Escherichia]|nr:MULTISPECIES: pheST operon leader peptide PheM [Escherichia]
MNATIFRFFFYFST